ncbi:MAG: SbcC/MukB-like Walker B domain-containing protein [Schumannella sp.]
MARKQARAEAAKQALVALEARREEIEQAKAALHRAGRAERVRPVLDDAGDKLAAWERATSDADDARRGYDGDVADDALAAEVSRLTEETGTLTEAVQDEQRADQLERDHAAQKDLADELVVALAKTTESIKSLQVERAELAPIAAQSKPAHDEVGRAKDRLAAATEAADIAGQLSTAQEAQLAADRLVTAARAVADDVFERFLHGQAAVLATQLVAGGPCAVCGSTEHPSPASFTGEPVAQDDVDDARAEVARLEPEANTAKERVEALKVAAAGLVGAAGDGDVDTLTAAVARAQAELKSATGAEQRIGQIDKELDGDEGLLAEQKRLEAAGKDAAAEVTKLKTERDSLAAKVARLRGDHPTVKAWHEALVAERDAAKRLADAVAALGTATQQHVDAVARLAAKLAQEKFESAEDLEGLCSAKRNSARSRSASSRTPQRSVRTRASSSNPTCRGFRTRSSRWTMRAPPTAMRNAPPGAATTERANAESAVTQLESKRKDLAALLAETEDLVARYDVLHRLSETVHGRTPNTKGMSLESYYIAAELEDVLTAANARLRTLSQGRIELRHTERGVRRANASAGLEIEVFDEFTGTARPANQLSGGQQFLASLALALGLAEVVTSRAGGIELNTLFVDEGFGSLSTEYLEIAMETLDSLKQGGRTVGVISHVSSMQEQIAAQLRVVAEPGGPSEILQDLPGTPAGVPRQRRRADDRAETRA